MKALLSGLVVFLVSWNFVGCSNDCHQSVQNFYPAPGQQAPHIAIITTGQIHLHYPAWLDKHPKGPQWKLQLLDEVHLTPPENDSRIPPGTKGAPPGTLVVVLDPGAYYATYSPSGLAMGEHRPPEPKNNIYFHTIYVAWKSNPNANGQVIPAYDHELRHLYTGDPKAGH